MNVRNITVGVLAVSFAGDPKGGQAYGEVYIQGYGNCKLTSVNNVYGLFMGTDAEKLYKWRALLRQCKTVVYVNFNGKSQRDFIKKHFEVYDEVKLPVGYGLSGDNHYQYHMFIRNTYCQNPSCLRPVEPKKQAVPQKVVVATGLSKRQVSTELRKVLKEKKRKTDFVSDFIKRLK